ncbi:hypothetical protein PNP59_00020 [Halobacterium salinarum]|uniref:hypothetical protein n=1 Tax=Halobacterium salinarum TaxID=2242 RepID=UPI002552E50F|nr:hypothetical protein [Halobacterium salinarum]MDL0129317.1 hypothetical protein [Halobacterium salinarum]
MRRSAIPLYKSRHVSFVKAILNAENPDKSIACHLGVGTGVRPDTVCHTHSNWFAYNDKGSLYYRVPASSPCRKYGDTSPCGDCSNNDHTKYEPKTPAAGGRQILITNEWTNPVTDEKEYFGLKDAVEQYFALNGDRAPDGVQHGHELIGGNGVSKGAYSGWVKDIGAKSEIVPELRENRIRKEIEIEDGRGKLDQQIIQFGTDENGNKIPELMPHDLRATYITHLMRNNVPPNKAIVKTGHTSPSSMQSYIRFARGEIDAREEETYY